MRATRSACGAGAQALAEEIEPTRENAAYLPGVTAARQRRADASLRARRRGARAVLLVPISRAMRETAHAVAPQLADGVPVLHATKGFELSSLRRLSEVIAEEAHLDPPRSRGALGADPRRGGG